MRKTIDKPDLGKDVSTGMVTGVHNFRNLVVFAMAKVDERLIMSGSPSPQMGNISSPGHMVLTPQSPKDPSYLEMKKLYPPIIVDQETLPVLDEKDEKEFELLLDLITPEEEQNLNPVLERMLKL